MIFWYRHRSGSRIYRWKFRSVVSSTLSRESGTKLLIVAGTSEWVMNLMNSKNCGKRKTSIYSTRRRISQSLYEEGDAFRNGPSSKKIWVQVFLIHIRKSVVFPAGKRMTGFLEATTPWLWNARENKKTFVYKCFDLHSYIRCRLVRLGYLAFTQTTRVQIPATEFCYFGTD